MALELRQREEEGILILEIKGRLIVGPDAGTLRQKVASLVDEGKTKTILDLKQVDFIDSTGLGTLVIGFTTMQKAGGALKLLHLSKRHIELLVLTKLTTIFEIFEEEQDAVNSFFPDREIKRFDILNFVKGQGKS